MLHLFSFTIVLCNAHLLYSLSSKKASNDRIRKSVDMTISLRALSFFSINPLIIHNLNPFLHSLLSLTISSFLLDEWLIDIMFVRELMYSYWQCANGRSMFSLIRCYCQTYFQTCARADALISIALFLQLFQLSCHLWCMRKCLQYVSCTCGSSWSLYCSREWIEPNYYSHLLLWISHVVCISCIHRAMSCWSMGRRCTDL